MPDVQTAVLTSTITATVTILTFMLSEPVKWFFRRRQEETLLRTLVRDLFRHLTRGIERIVEIQMKHKCEKTAVLHIRKLKIDEKNPIFSDDNLRYLGAFHAARVAALRLRLRNFNIDCDYLEKIYEHGDRDLFFKVLDFVLKRSFYLRHQVEQTLMHYPSAPPFRDEMLFFDAAQKTDWPNIPFAKND